MRVRRSGGRDQRGAAAVEFALVVVPFVTLVFGAIDVGVAVNADVVVNNAAREGVREGSLNPDQTAITSAARASLGSMGPGATVTVTCLTPSGGACTLATSAPGNRVVVKVSVHHDWISPMGDLFSAGGITLNKTAEMRIE